MSLPPVYLLLIEPARLIATLIFSSQDSLFFAMVEINKIYYATFYFFTDVFLV